MRVLACVYMYTLSHYTALRTAPVYVSTEPLFYLTDTFFIYNRYSAARLGERLVGLRSYDKRRGRKWQHMSYRIK